MVSFDASTYFFTFLIAFLFEIIGLLVISFIAAQSKINLMKNPDKDDKKDQDLIKNLIGALQAFWTLFVVFMFIFFYFANSAMFKGFGKVHYSYKIFYFVTLIILIILNLVPVFITSNKKTNIINFTVDKNGTIGTGLSFASLSFLFFGLFLFLYYVK